MNDMHCTETSPLRTNARAPGTNDDGGIGIVEGAPTC
jgi:hypothetical protein